MNQIVITVIDSAMVCLYMQGEVIYDVVAWPADQDINIGDIYIGKVSRVVDNIHAAFVEIVPGTFGFLPLRRGEQKLIRPEYELPVRIKKPAKGTKDILLSRDIEMVSRYAVLTASETMEIGVSKRIRDEAVKNKLLTLVREHVQRLSIDINASLTVRTNAASADDTAVLADIDRLISSYLRITEYKDSRRVFSRLYSEGAAFFRFINRYKADELDRVITDDPRIYEQLKEYESTAENIGFEPVLYDDKSYPLNARYAIRTTIDKALERRVWLKSGANLIIDKTEAMTVIDVNSAKAVEGKRAVESTFFKINMEAADEVGRQLRLRNLSGMILVDFIDMKEKKHTDELIAHLRSVLSRDPQRAMFADLTKLGIAEIVRSSESLNLHDAMEK